MTHRKTWHSVQSIRRSFLREAEQSLHALGFLHHPRIGQGFGVGLGSAYPTVSRPRLFNDREWSFDRDCARARAGLRPIPRLAVENCALDFALIDGDRGLNIGMVGKR